MIGSASVIGAYARFMATAIEFFKTPLGVFSLMSVGPITAQSAQSRAPAPITALAPSRP